MEKSKGLQRHVALILLLTFMFWQVSPYVYAETSFNAPLTEQFIAPENNPQSATMTPETSTNPDEEDYIEGYGPNDLGMVTDLKTEDETANALSLGEGTTVISEAVPPESAASQDVTVEQAMQQELAAIAQTPVQNENSNVADETTSRNLAATEQQPASPVVSVIGTNGTVTQQGTVINWTAVNGASGYEVEISRNADFSDPLQLQNQYVSTNEFHLPDFSQGTFYIRVRATQGTGETRTVMTGWSGARQFSMRVTYPVYLTPLSYAQGGVDANILDWTPSTNGSVQGYAIYRRVFGTTEWELIHDNGQLTRFIDTDIDSAVAYQYQVRAYTATDQIATPITLEQSANYDAAYQGSIQPENVLALVNTNEMGYVNIGQVVPNADAAYGHLEPISETQLLAYLGRQASDWEDADGDGIYYLYDPTHQFIYARKDTRNGASLIETPLGVYYAIRREIPVSNICFLTIPPSYSNERADMGITNFQNLVVNPIHDYMVANHLSSQITSVVSIYHFPLVIAGHSWEEQLNWSLWESSGVLPPTTASEWIQAINFHDCWVMPVF